MNIQSIRSLILKSLLLWSAIAYCTTTLAASAPGAPQTQPGLIFEEPWQAYLANSNLELKLSDPAVDQLQITGVQGSDPGLCRRG